VVEELDRIQYREGGAAGVPLGDGELWKTTLAAFLCEIERTKGISGCVRLLGREGEQEEVAGVPDVVGIGGAHRQYLRASTRNSAAAS
jgi:hypothetical protein